MPYGQRTGLQDVLGVGDSGREDQTKKHSELQSESTGKRAQEAEDQTGQQEINRAFMNELSPLNFVEHTDPGPKKFRAAGLDWDTWSQDSALQEEISIVNNLTCSINRSVTSMAGRQPETTGRKHQAVDPPMYNHQYVVN